MTPSQLYNQESQNGKLKAEIKQMLGEKALNRYEAEELIQLTVLNELDRPRKIYPTEIKRIKENPNLTPNEKLDIITTLYTNNGYHVVERDRLGIQLFKKKKFSYLSAFLWFLLKTIEMFRIKRQRRRYKKEDDPGRKPEEFKGAGCRGYRNYDGGNRGNETRKPELQDAIDDAKRELLSGATVRDTDNSDEPNSNPKPNSRRKTKRSKQNSSEED